MNNGLMSNSKSNIDTIVTCVNTNCSDNIFDNFNHGHTSVYVGSYIIPK